MVDFKLDVVNDVAADIGVSQRRTNALKFPSSKWKNWKMMKNMTLEKVGRRRRVDLAIIS